MNRSPGRVLVVEVLLVVAILAALAEVALTMRQEAWFDVAALAAFTVAAGLSWAVLRRTTETLDASVAAREELRSRLEQQQAVAELGQLALTDLPTPELLDEATRVLTEHLRTDLAAVLELQPDGDFVSRASRGWPPGIRVPGGPSSQAGFTLEAGGPVILHDAARETRFEVSRAMTAAGVTSGVSTPIGSNGGTYGVISVHTRTLRQFSDHDASFIAAIANVLASALRRQRAESEAESTHRVLEAVIEGTSDDIFVKDLDGRLVAMNAKAARTMGRPVRELLGRTLHDVLPTPMADAMDESDRITLERGTVETSEETILVDGVERVFLTTKGPFRARDGTLLGTFGIAHDITRRKAQERALARSEERFRLAQEGARMGTWDIDLLSGTTTWSDGLRKIYGVDADFPAGFAHVEPLIHPDDRESVSPEVLQAYAIGASFEFEFRLIRPDGETRWMLSRSNCIRDESGKPVRQLGVSVDITERKLAEEELRSAQQERAELELRLHQSEKLEAVGRLAGGVAHDFNNLLVAITGYSELALSRLQRGNPSASDHIVGVLTAADRAAGLTKQLLAFARRQVLSPEVLDLNEVVEQTGALLERLIGDDVELVTVLATRPVVVQADRGQLEQVIVNLAVNARDAMSEGGTLTISVGRDDGAGHALLTVADDGSGIDAETAEHIFEPFFTTKGEDGTGLGLATVHGVVAQSGGEIALDTELGHGSTFTISLPLRGDTLTHVEADENEPCLRGSETLLLVEDDPTVRTVVSTMLETYGYDVVATSGGDEAIECFASTDRTIPLVLSDFMMRGLDGQQTVHRIRELVPTTKALLMSGYTDGIVVRSDTLAEGTGFIQKPFAGDQLARRIRELLDGVSAAV